MIYQWLCSVSLIVPHQFFIYLAHTCLQKTADYVNISKENCISTWNRSICMARRLSGCTRGAPGSLTVMFARGHHQISFPGSHHSTLHSHLVLGSLEELGSQAPPIMTLEMLETSKLPWRPFKRQQTSARSLGAPQMNKHSVSQTLQSFTERYQRSQNISDLDTALQYDQQAVQLTASGDPDRPIRLQNLAVSLTDRYCASGDLKDLEAALEKRQEAVAIAPSDDPDGAGLLQIFAMALRD
jgi:hypothetical protein